MHNDPVNCVDLWGLTASDSQAAGGSKETTEETVSNPDTNRTSRKGVDINYFPKDEKIYKYARKIDNPIDDEIFTVGGHGSTFSMSDDTKAPLSASTVAEIIKQDNNYEQGMTVMLLSCNTGRSDTSFAQDLADELGTGEKVIAPTKTLWISKDGSLEVYDEITEEGETTKEYGEWRTFIGR